MANGRTFVNSSAKRIAKVVRRVEQMPQKLDPGPGRDQGPMPFLFRRFELKTDFTAGGSASVYPVFHDGSDWVPDTDADKEFTVHDFLSEWSGSGRIEADPLADPPVAEAAGSRGYAIKMHDFADWEILIMECP